MQLLNNIRRIQATQTSFMSFLQPIDGNDKKILVQKTDIQ